MHSLGSTTNSLFKSNNAHDSKTITVETTSLDCFFQRSEALVPNTHDQTKCAGAEILALKGMHTVIEKVESLSLICELKRETLEMAKSEPRELLELLQEFNFKIIPVGTQHEVSLANLENVQKRENLHITCSR
jgi:hypothetical protein